MGNAYTHRFLKNRKPTEQEWDTIVRVANFLVENTPMSSISAGGFFEIQPLRGALTTYEEGKSASIGDFNNTAVNVNHSEPNVVQSLLGHPAIIFDGKLDLGNEPFVLTNAHPADDQAIESGVPSCKTNRLPYDLLVCAMLILINHHIPDLLIINSDGGVEDWEPALRLARMMEADALLPIVIDRESSCRPSPMTHEDLYQSVCQFIGSSSEAGLYF